jgi:hypothetical protein
VPQIMISYRRGDTGVITGRIFDRLVAHFGRDAIFRDIDNIPIGVDFRAHLDQVLSACNVVIAIVGPEWMGPPGGANRLQNEADPVRLEIEAALYKGVPIVPVLTLGAEMPASSQLPNSLKDFAYRNALHLDAGQDFDVHIARLLRALDALLDPGGKRDAPDDGNPAFARTPRPAVPWFALALGAILLVVAAGSASWFMASRSGKSGPPAAGDSPAKIAAATQTPAPATNTPANATEPAATSSPAPETSPPPTPPQMSETTYWETIETKGTIGAFEDYLEKYPDGPHAGMARDRLASLEHSPPPTPPVNPHPDAMTIGDLIVDGAKLNGKVIKVYGKFSGCVMNLNRNLCSITDEKVFSAYRWFDPSQLPRDDYKKLIECTPFQCMLTVGGLYRNVVGPYHIQATSIEVEPISGY